MKRMLLVAQILTMPTLPMTDIQIAERRIMAIGPQIADLQKALFAL